MPKYEAEINDLKPKVGAASNILVVLAKKTTVDDLSSGLALYLSLKQAGKNVSVISEDSPLVAHGNIFGIGDVKNSIPSTGNGGNFVITLEGVVASDGNVPALEKLDWFPQGEDLNLVFHVSPGQKFEPRRVIPKYQSSGGYDIIFILGAANPAELGTAYSANIEIFSNSYTVNIDNDENNTRFGKTNLVDPQASSVSEMVGQIIIGANLPYEGDMASNILKGIYDATANLIRNVSPDTFSTVGLAMQVGGKVPSAQEASSAPSSQAYIPEVPKQPTEPQKQYVESTFDYRQLMQQPPTGTTLPLDQNTNNSFSNEDRPAGEFSTTTNPEVAQPMPDWLTPKVYKGGKVG